MEWTDIISLFLATIAIIVSIVALVKNQKTQNKMLQIEQSRERERQFEKRRARITAKLEHLQKYGRYELVITNTGSSEARDVKPILNGETVSKLKSIEPKTPSIPKIGPHSSTSYHWRCEEDVRPPFDLEITWSDDSGEPGCFSTILHHPTTPKKS